MTQLVELGKYAIKVSKGVKLCVRIQPRASKTAFVGPYGESLKIRVAASSVEGQANRELCRFLAQELGMALKDVEVVTGLGSRQKSVLLKGKVLSDVRDSLIQSLTQKKP